MRKSKRPSRAWRTPSAYDVPSESHEALAEELDADETRLVHVSHFYPADEAFAEPLAVDGEQYRL